MSDYVAGIRSPKTGIMRFVDGTDEELGYPSRYMNHDGKPNVGRRSFFGEEDNECRILMYSLRDILPGEEMMWNCEDPRRGTVAPRPPPARA